MTSSFFSCHIHLNTFSTLLFFKFPPPARNFHVFIFPETLEMNSFLCRENSWRFFNFVSQTFKALSHRLCTRIIFDQLGQRSPPLSPPSLLNCSSKRECRFYVHVHTHPPMNTHAHAHMHVQTRVHNRILPHTHAQSNCVLCA